MSTRRLLPSPTERLRFREMVPADLDEMAAMLGDPEVMTFFPATKTRDGAAAWIAQNRQRYAEHGHGLWVIETHRGDFVGDCGITWQSANGHPVLEVGYHLPRERHRQGYATEAARACVDLVRRELSPTLLTAIIHPDNVASRRVAEKIGMTHIDDDRAHPWIVRTVMGMQVEPDSPVR